MRRHKPLRGDPDTHREWVRRSQDTARAKAQQAPQRPRDTGPDRATRRALARRSGDRCELCAAWLRTAGRNVHHRQPRGAGGSTRPEVNVLSALLDLCPACHQTVELNRAWAKDRGLLVPWPSVPALVPAELRYGRVRLDDAGDWQFVDNHGPKGEAA